MNYAQGNLSPNVGIVPGAGSMGSADRKLAANIDPDAITGMLNLFGIATPMQKNAGSTLAKLMGLVKEDAPMPSVSTSGGLPSDSPEGAAQTYDAPASDFAAQTKGMDQWLDNSTANANANADAIRGMTAILTNPKMAPIATEKAMGFPIAQIMAQYAAAKDAAALPTHEVFDAEAGGNVLKQATMNGGFKIIGNAPVKSEQDLFLRTPEGADAFRAWQTKKKAEDITGTAPAEADAAKQKETALIPVQVSKEWQMIGPEAAKASATRTATLNAEIAANPNMPATSQELQTMADKNGNRIPPQMADPVTGKMRNTTKGDLGRIGAVDLPKESFDKIQAAKTIQWHVDHLKTMIDKLPFNDPGFMNLIGSKSLDYYATLKSNDPQLAVFNAETRAALPLIGKSLFDLARFTQPEFEMYQPMMPQIGKDSLVTARAKLDNLNSASQNTINTVLGKPPAPFPETAGRAPASRFKVLSVK